MDIYMQRLNKESSDQKIVHIKKNSIVKLNNPSKNI